MSVDTTNGEIQGDVITAGLDPDQQKQRIRFTRDEIPRLVGMFGFIAALHVIGWGLFVHYNSISRIHNLVGSDNTLVYAGAGTLAYTLGLRHAFDADHISAVDDTTRYLLQKGKRPLAVGLFFSLGHSTVVFVFVSAIAIVASKATAFQEAFQGTGGIIGTLVSGFFLYLIAALNLAVLTGIIRVWRQAKRGTYSVEELDELLAKRGFMNRIFKGKYNQFINHSWQMYPVGLLFGLGFDTATQVGLIAIAGTTALAGGLPPLAIIALPIIFAAGMSLMDTLDGVFMSKAYGWAFVSPVRKIYYNITTTGLSIFVAFAIGTVEIAGLLIEKAGLTGQPWDFIAGIDINLAGRIIVGIFLAVWIGAILNWKIRKLDERYGDGDRALAEAPRES
ncbi:MAG: HoxN/HupN/NixA family nickel/cobalt transporter [Actinobacteria bacterium]|nr:HoxN/HupN/NixA family nickel/cobalt transporter [Actinomycetota bacterium]MCA1720017.1 HoxN/HupN/NixA family nickel/cobalt transporter [Actinomycetota bacterium]